MNPRRFTWMLALAAFFAFFAVPAAAQDVDTILRRPLEAVASGPVLGPIRLQGDFAPHLGEVLAQAAPDAASASAAAAPPPATRPQRRETQETVVAPILGGIVGGFAGLYGGAILGLALSDDSGGGWDEYGAALGGAFLGETLLLPVGVHLFNSRKGSFLADLGVSLAAGFLGVGIGAAVGGGGEGFIAAGALQLGAVVMMERSGGRRRIAEREAAESP